MSQRLAKVASLVQQIAAEALHELLGSDSAKVTVTAVELAPDLKLGTVWLGILGDEAERTRLLAEAKAGRSEIQATVARQLTTKYVPKLQLRLDQSGNYAAHIDQVIREL